jgi:hypothetical protein
MCVDFFFWFPSSFPQTFVVNDALSVPMTTPVFFCFLFIFGKRSFSVTTPRPPKKEPKKEVDYFWRHQPSNLDYDKAIENSIPSRKKTYYGLRLVF